ncbi:MAG: hypothetical protein QOF89_5416 [Acidobacteriota bacterium]|jgi:ELWxxDGT repeat protein|nr:hypothetical protein [Acidobacteriota bacterium]
MARALILVLCLLALLPTPPEAAAATASLVRDIDPRRAEPGSGGAFGPLLSIGDKALFLAFEGGSGGELWVSDGSPLGTSLVRDLCSNGSCPFSPTFLGVLQGGVGILQVPMDVGGERWTEIWRSDGTRQGTRRLTAGNKGGPEPCPGPPQPAPVSIGTAVLFAGFDFATGCEPWATDGTAQGTRRLGDLSPGPSPSSPQSFTAAGGKAYFSTFSPGALWQSDGTPAGTRKVRSLSTDPFAGLRLVVAAGSRLFFVAPQDGDEMWVSDGTEAGTRPVSTFANPEPFGDPHIFSAVDGAVYFTAFEGTLKLWRSDETGTRALVSLAGSGYFGPSGVVKAGSRAVFVADAPGSPPRLWTTNGTAQTTAPLAGCPGGCPSPRGELVSLGGRVLFPATDPVLGTELWSTDGTGAGTVLVRDLCPGGCSSEPHGFTLQLGKAVFVAGGPTGTALWATDGTAAGTVRLADLRSEPAFDHLLSPVTIGRTLLFSAFGDGGAYQLWASDGTAEGTGPVTLFGGGRSSNPHDLTAFAGGLLFNACDESGCALWRSDGSFSGTVPLTATKVLPSSGFLSRPSVSGGLAFFIRDEAASGGPRIWRTDGTNAGSFPVTPPGLGELGEPVTFGGRTVFLASPEGGASALWESDGTVAGTRKRFDLSADLRFPRALTALAPELYFVADSGATSNQLWRSDGTAAGTRQITAFAVTSGFYDEPQLARAGSLVLFAAGDSFNRALWKTDGTAAGTSLVLTSSQARNPSSLFGLQGVVYFMAWTAEGRQGLWKSDGSAAGTVLLKSFKASVPPGPTEVPPALFTPLENRLFFVADDGERGRELWCTDGAPGDAVLVKDIAQGEASSNPSSLVVGGDLLFFTANDGEHGAELWQSDDMEDGTLLVQDLAPGGSSSNPKELTVVGSNLFFSADDGLTGTELWTYPLAGPAGCQPSDEALCLSGGRFRVTATWRDFQGHDGRGHAVALTGDTGYFWFFSPTNVEVILKVLDARSFNGHHWVYYGALSNVEYTLTITDTQTGAARRYVNPSGRLASVGDVQAFGPLGAKGAGLTFGPEGIPIEPVVGESRTAAKASVCVPDSLRLCLGGGRFAVEARWHDFQGNTGSGTAVPLSGDTGYFWFFSPTNVEVVLKVLDGRTLNNKFWVFYGALSNVEYTLTVTDTQTGVVKTYTNPSGRLGSVADTSAF